ncbi:hypothetical protein SKAU_G00238600 [Synaphobranchus kaupii]|uniref:Uncharacterized protein n=1 Tax=Synaphobranchus kaupii TaxID=118154 RepID=A0A9Q1F741_SYNKA|nr:hypothetical protein SKAU_G00238600 [Synaphobranchus kaupii]
MPRTNGQTELINQDRSRSWRKRWVCHPPRPLSCVAVGPGSGSGRPCDESTRHKHHANSQHRPARLLQPEQKLWLST